MSDARRNPCQVLVLAGPTASGKSALALAVAEQYPVTIINCDSKQLYEELRILSARPSREEEAQAPHALYGVVKGDDNVSAGAWVRLVVPEIRRCWGEGRLPLLVGGSGLYVKALMEGFAMMPEIPAEVREEAKRLRAELGLDGLVQEVLRQCPDMEEGLERDNAMRVMRAWEVWKYTGRSIKSWQDEPMEKPLPEAEFVSFMLLRDREELYKRANARVHIMLEEGVLDEVRALMERGYAEDSPLMKAHGVPHFVKYLHGEMGLEEAIQLTQRDTRHYIKRQHTWWRNQTQGFHTLSMPPMTVKTACEYMISQAGLDVAAQNDL